MTLTRGIAGLLLFAASCAILIAQTRVAAGLPIVQDGRPAAVILLAADANAVSRYAAAEIVEHVRRATGVKLPIVAEEQAIPAGTTRLYLGATDAAQAAHVDVHQLKPETFTFKTVTDGLIIAGADGEGDPLDVNVPAGTLFGVYEWIERVLGVRWLWPGELGTYVPRAATIISAVKDETVAPVFTQRQVRGGLNFTSTHASLGFSASALADYRREQAVFLRRHRMGKSERLTYGHAFTDWWKKYGAEHPEWFQLVNGKRGPTKPGGSYSMCVSNPEFQHKIVELWKERREKDGAAATHFLNVVENGIMGLCECEACRAWDGPQPADYMAHYIPRHKMTGSHCVTDRYARFWLAVQAEARKVDPQVTLVVYNYFNYYYFPSDAIRLNDHILVGSYPSSGWFPRSVEQNEWFKRQWRGWQRTGAKLFSRGNYCLDGYCMPFIFAHEFADEFKFQVSTGMVATDYDALTGQWSTQGPNLYLLMRLHVRPDAATDDLLDEYYSAFGAAAPLVRDYFVYWERYVRDQREQTERAFDELDASRWRSWPKVAHVVFPESCFTPAEALLARAAAATASAYESEAAGRVEFLQLGLEHARLCSRAARQLTLARADSPTAAGVEALAQLVAFRRQHEREWIGNFNHSAWLEEAAWKLPSETSMSAEH